MNFAPTTVHSFYSAWRAICLGPAPETRATHTLLHSEEMAKATYAHAHS